MKTSLQKPGYFTDEADLMIACAFRAEENATFSKAKLKNLFDITTAALKELDRRNFGQLLSAAHEEGFSAEEGLTFRNQHTGTNQKLNLSRS